MTMFFKVSSFNFMFIYDITLISRSCRLPLRQVTYITLIRVRLLRDRICSFTWYVSSLYYNVEDTWVTEMQNSCV